MKAWPAAHCAGNTVRLCGGQRTDFFALRGSNTVRRDVLDAGWPDRAPGTDSPVLQAGHDHRVGRDQHLAPHTSGSRWRGQPRAGQAARGPRPLPSPAAALRRGEVSLAATTQQHSYFDDCHALLDPRHQHAREAREIDGGGGLPTCPSVGDEQVGVAWLSVTAQPTWALQHQAPAAPGMATGLLDLLFVGPSSSARSAAASGRHRDACGRADRGHAESRWVRARITAARPAGNIADRKSSRSRPSRAGAGQRSRPSATRRELGLANVTTLHVRVEQLQPQAFDTVIGTCFRTAAAAARLGCSARRSAHPHRRDERPLAAAAAPDADSDGGPLPPGWQIETVRPVAVPGLAEARLSDAAAPCRCAVTAQAGLPRLPTSL